jgi:hypothetical protein
MEPYLAGGLREDAGCVLPDFGFTASSGLLPMAIVAPPGKRIDTIGLRTPRLRRRGMPSRLECLHDVMMFKRLWLIGHAPTIALRLGLL